MNARRMSPISGPRSLQLDRTDRFDSLRYVRREGPDPARPVLESESHAEMARAGADARDRGPRSRAAGA